MTGRELAYIGIRLMAIYLALQVLYSLAGVAETLLAWDAERPVAINTGSLLYYGLVSTLIYLVASIGLWIGAGRIAQVTLPQAARPAEHGALSVREWQAIAFSSVGLLVLVSALPKIGAELYRTYLTNEAFGIPPLTHVAQKAYRFRIALEAVFGTGLLLAGGALAGLLARFREIGLPPRE